ncbi:hypothetical protein HYH03_011349 [Edaphochlamys debaryana]|uniref:Peptidase S9 prolyl oligopeptidase catalytic domain-containing protein n=1 Tax=Edaphochlamys debaryana TaxID=47281 RepID=A0A836BWL0_9CHLO|nr:hypothetical protein HYH03_011349 [Edaphochlamys debaryana]|eukprot:KAG2490224.1 hypothetical protein HYH03_011349 [Edaphochlamys debaryana]
MAAARHALLHAIRDAQTAAPIAPKIVAAAGRNVPPDLNLTGLAVEELAFLADPDAEEPQRWAPLRVIRPSGPTPEAQQERRPAVVFLHATGESMDVTLPKQCRFARLGYVTAVVEARYHGQRAAVPPWLPAAVEAAGASAQGSEPTAAAVAGLTTPATGETQPATAVVSAWVGAVEEFRARRGEDATRAVLATAPVAAGGCSDGPPSPAPTPKDPRTPRDVYDLALVAAWRGSGERPFLLDTVRDLRRALDVLCVRGDVDAARVGMTGVSAGGMWTWLCAVADERVAVAAPVIGVQGFGWAVEHEAYQGRVDSIPLVFEVAASDLGQEAPSAGPGRGPKVTPDVVRAVWARLLPGILEGYDTPLSLPAIAPRPLLVANGGGDPRTPLPGVEQALAAARAAYEAWAEGQLGAEAEAEVEAEAEAGAKVEVEAEAEVGERAAVVKAEGPSAGDGGGEVGQGRRGGGGGGGREARVAALVDPRLRLWVEEGVGHRETEGMRRQVEVWMDAHLLGA